MDMDRDRIKEEVIELLCNKLHTLPLPSEDPEYDYEGQKLVPDITDNQLDIAEVAMDLEDAFCFNFESALPGGEGLETIGKIIDFIQRQVTEKFPQGA